MAVVTLYFQSLLILLIGFSNLVQGRSLLPPRNRQPVTEPRQTPGFTVLNSFGDRYMLSQSSRPKAQINAPFQGSGYLQVWPADFFSLSIGPLGWINSYGEWTNDEKRRALFDADVNRMLAQHPFRTLQICRRSLLTQHSRITVGESGIAVLESNRGSCLIRTDTHLLDCVTKPVTVRIARSIGIAYGPSWQIS